MGPGISEAQRFSK